MQTLRGKVGLDSIESGAIRCLYVGITYSVWSIIFLPIVTFVLEFIEFMPNYEMNSSVKSVKCWQWNAGVECHRFVWSKNSLICIKGQLNVSFCCQRVSDCIRVYKICWNFYLLHFGVSVTNRVGYNVRAVMKLSMPLEATRHQIVWSSISTTS